MSTETYADTHEHLLAELDRIRTMLTASRVADSDKQLPTDVVEEDSQSAPQPDEETDVQLSLPPAVRGHLARRRSEIDRRCRQTDGATPRLRRLADRFGLSDAHVDVLLLTVAPHVDEEFGALFEEVGPLFEQVGDTRHPPVPTVGLLERLYESTDPHHEGVSHLVDSESPLVQRDLLRVVDSSLRGETSHQRRLLPGERAHWCLGREVSFDTLVSDAAALTTADTELTDLRLEQSVRDRVETAAHHHRSSDDADVFYFHGPDGSEKHAAVDAVLDDGRSYVRADLRELVASGGLDRFRREALLRDCPVHLTHVGAATTRSDSLRLTRRSTSDDSPDDTPTRGASTTDTPTGDASATGTPTRGASATDTPTVEDVIDTLASLEQDIFLTSEREWTPSRTQRDTSDTVVEFPIPSTQLRREVWQTYTPVFEDDVEVETLASTYRLTPGQIDDAADTARRNSTDPDENSLRYESFVYVEDYTLSHDALVEGCKAQSTVDLDSLGERLSPVSDWDDIALDDDTRRQLQHVVDHITRRGIVSDEDGYGDARDTSVSALFTGPSGTGKSLAAEVVATEAGMDVYKIGLGSLVGRSGGKLGDRLDRVFEAARDSNVILLFDEVIPVFGERLPVAGVQDDEVPAELKCFRQHVEAYDGVVLLTVNNVSIIDPAFRGHVNHAVQFSRPDEETRREIWKHAFTDDAPTEDLDYEFLATFDLTGADIGNVARTAIILGSAGRGIIRMEHVVEGLQQELNALERPVDASRFEPYDHLLRVR